MSKCLAERKNIIEIGREVRIILEGNLNELEEMKYSYRELGGWQIAVSSHCLPANVIDSKVAQ